MGSNPLPPPKILIGWQDKILLVPSIQPFINPNSLRQSIKYSEQVGRYLQLFPSKGDKNN